jgi:hypothetical protein
MHPINDLRAASLSAASDVTASFGGGINVSGGRLAAAAGGPPVALGPSALSVVPEALLEAMMMMLHQLPMRVQRGSRFENLLLRCEETEKICVVGVAVTMVTLLAR